MTILENPPPSGASPSTPGSAEGMARRSWRIDIPGATVDDIRPIKWQLYLSLVGLALGALMGLLQALERLDHNLYEEVGLQTYYQGLTLHGVALALVFTFCFANSFLSLITMRGFGRPLASRVLSYVSAYLAWAGVALAAWAILANKATVLFTFYAPLEATPAFYLGAVLLVVSTWVVLLNQMLTLRAWRKEHAAEGRRRIPLASYISIITSWMWFLASLGIAVEVLVMVLPWSLGWTDTIDPQFTRVLFWFTGHPIVYYWLLPVYVSWYTLLPKQAGGKGYSDGLTRMVFLAFLLLLPVGIHHQFTDPGIEFSSKTIQWGLTFAIFFPSTVTLFSVVASLEGAGRARGGKGLLGWIPKLPWGDPSVAGQLLAGITFMLGGASGLVNASWTVNKVVHNTAFIPGHFHLTVGTGVALSVMAICYWLVPYFTGKQLWGRRIAVAQVWLWTIGVWTFSRGQMMGGLEGMPRRTEINSAPYAERFSGNDFTGWDEANFLTGIGGTVMFLSALLFFIVILATIHNRRIVTVPQTVPLAEVTHGPKRSWVILDDLKTWIIVAVVLVVVIYGEVVFHYWPLNSVSGGFKLW
ncbi:MAG: cbb3-type cytochrome c oxidase subunit I [Acidimicrobiales bacterium]|jgi:cytochrome c oxidase subunit 1|nr:cbb3-type cytochrome c oxidase subunit I [Acidimicrobiales bacterium]